MFTLKFAGHDVTATTNGEEAVQAARQDPPDLILMDVRMPRMSGYQACELIKNSVELRHIPVVFLSAKGQESEIRTGLDAGADDYILKPFSPDQLTGKVAEILSRG